MTSSTSASSISRSLTAPLARAILATSLLFLAASATAGTLYFAHIFQPDIPDGFIQRVDTDGTNLQPILTTGSGVRGLALDPAAGKLYWTDVTNVGVWRAGLDGANPEQIVTDNLEFPRTIAFYQPAGKIFYADQLADFIGKADADGANPQFVRSTAYHAGMAIDAVHAKLYWTTSITDMKGNILRSNLDGSAQETVVTSNAPQFKPAGLAVDPVGGKIYWTDYVVDVIRRSNLDGTNIEDLYAVGSNRNPRPITLDLAAGKVYWGQDVEIFGYTGKIMRMNLDGSAPETVLDGIGLVTEVALLPSAACHPCDVNCDGSLNQFDIQPFVEMVSHAGTPCSPCAADTNADGSINQFDIQAFVDCLTQP